MTSGKTVLRRVQAIGLAIKFEKALSYGDLVLYMQSDPKVQDYLGHASVQTTRIYDKRKDDLDDSPTFKVKY
jgi:integrase